MKLFGKREIAVRLRKSGEMRDEDYLACFGAGASDRMFQGVEELLGRLEDEYFDMAGDPKCSEHVRNDCYAKIEGLREVRKQMHANERAHREMVARG